MHISKIIELRGTVGSLKFLSISCINLYMDKNAIGQEGEKEGYNYDGCCTLTVMTSPRSSMTMLLFEDWRAVQENGKSLISLSSF